MSPINQINRSGTEALTGNSKARSKTTTEEIVNNETPAGSAAEDKVSLSEQSQQVRELQKQLDQVPEVDAEKVKAIKQAIARGDYPVDANKIAANMVNLEKMLSE